MKVLLVVDTYWPEFTATGMIITDLAEYLAAQGHEVTVLCPGPMNPRGSDEHAPPKETREGVSIRRLPLVLSGRLKFSRFGRIINFLGFHVLGGWWLLGRTRSFDTVISMDGPPLAGLHVTFARHVYARRVRHICWTMDLLPDKHFELGHWSRRNPAAKLMHYLSLLPFRKADLTVALSRCMKRRLAGHGVSEEKIEVIGVWAPGEAIQPKPADQSSFRKRLGLDRRFVVMYAGNAGSAHTLEAVSQAVERLREDPRIMFVFVGGGHRMMTLKAKAEKHGYQNFRHVPYVRADELPDVLAASDAQLVTLEECVVGTCLPSKLYVSMAAARPTLFVGPTDGDTARHIREANCGMVFSQTDADGLVQAIQSLAEDPSECRRRGANGRQAYEGKHAMALTLARWQEVLSGLEPKTPTSSH